ncbi:MAG: hypothetical protein V5A43_07220 [Haloarculaceae archaeon]
MSESSCDTSTADAARDHLSDLPDGCGCAEVWEYLSEARDSEAE